MVPASYQTISTLSSVLREILLPEIREQLADQVHFMQVFKRTMKTVRRVGRDFKAFMAIRTSHNQAVGNRAAGAQLPPHGKPTYDQIEVQLNRTYGQGAFDRAILSKPLKGQASVLADLLDTEMTSLLRTLQVDLARQIQLDGSGAMAQVTTADGTGDTFTVDDARYLEPGMLIDSYTAKTGGSQHFDALEIEDVDQNTNQVVLTASASFYQDDYLFRDGNRGLEANGLLAAVDDGNVVSSFQGQDRSASSLFKANLVDAGGNALSMDHLLKTFEKGSDISGLEPDFIGSDAKSQRYYALLLESQRRQVNTTALKAGWKGLEFSSGGKTIGWFADRFFWPLYIYFLHKKNWSWFEAGAPDWVHEDGAILHRISDYDMMEFTLAYYWNLGIDRCNSQHRLYNFTKPGA